MGRALSAGPWGRPEFAGSDIDVTRLLVATPDTIGDLRAGEINQFDPQADIFRLLGSGAVRMLVRYSGSSSLTGPVLIGGAGPATVGFDADVANALRVGGDVTVVGVINGGIVAVTAFGRAMINTEGTPLAAGELVQIVGGGANRVARTLATAVATVDTFGAANAVIAAGGTGLILFGGNILVQFATGLAMAEGQRAYLSPATAGAATNVQPAVVGQVIADIGTITDVSMYVGGVATNSLARVQLDKSLPIVV